MAAGHQDVPIKDLTLLGSHDAGCVEGRCVNNNGVPDWISDFTPPASWAVTQTQSLHKQLCAGYRVFDIRFKMFQDNWRIHHGGFYFDDLATVAAHFGAFCREGKGTEAIIIRLKVEGKAVDWRVWEECIERLQNAIDNHGRGRKGSSGTLSTQESAACVVSKDSQTFTGDTIEQLKASIPNDEQTHNGARHAGSPIVIMPYVKDKKDRATIMAALRTSSVGPYVFDYFLNQFGKYSNTLHVKEVLKGQKKQLQEYTSKLKEEPNLTFGYWMTLTFDKNKLWRGIKLNVEKNTRKLFDSESDNTGKHKRWLCNLGEEYGASGMQGWTIWTDFAGDPRMKYVATDGVDINTQGWSPRCPLEAKAEL